MHALQALVCTYMIVIIYFFMFAIFPFFFDQSLLECAPVAQTFKGCFGGGRPSGHGLRGLGAI